MLLGDWLLVSESHSELQGLPRKCSLSRSSDRANPYFVLQRRRGHDEENAGLASIFVATIDSVLDSKVKQTSDTGNSDGRSSRHIDIESSINDPIRKFTIVIIDQMIFLSNDMRSMVCLVIAEADTKEEIEEHWKWIDEHLLPALATIHAGVDVTDYVQSKIKSLCAQVDEADIDGEGEGPLLSLPSSFLVDFESDKFKNATKKFHKLFNIPVDEKLVTCQSTHFSFSLIHVDHLDYSCSYWRGRVPRQGWLYLSVNYLCFYSYLLGKDITIVLKFTDITVKNHQ